MYIVEKCVTHKFNSLKDYKWVDIISFYKNKWVFCKHKERQTWENPGGHIEISETPLEAAKRELFEETGALKYDIKLLCDYYVSGLLNGKNFSGNGQVFLANVHSFDKIPDNSEMEKIDFFALPPNKLTYPIYAEKIFPMAMELFKEINVEQNA
jgi:8-oxo-dGTP diphosphatase